MSTRFIVAAAAAVVTTGLLAAPASASSGVRLLGEKIVPHGLVFEGTTVGGLSGIDRDPRTGDYVLVSDDRSSLQPARFYTARIPVSSRGLGDVTFTGTRPLLQPDGTTYPKDAVDPEEIRVDPWTGRYTWSQEGGRAPAPVDPSIRNATRDGKFVNELPLPANEKVAEGHGVRPNDALEGLSYTPDGMLLVSSVEAPLAQEGPPATTEHGALSRITVQARTGHLLAQYAYPMEPVFAKPVPPTASANNGVSAILAVGTSKFLVVERAFVPGAGNKIRIYEASAAGATNVLSQDVLADDVKPMRKRLLADLTEFKLSTVDNIEGITWGPRLPSR